MKHIRMMDWIEAALLAAMAPLFIFPRINRLWPFLIFPILWLVRFLFVKLKGSDSYAGSPIDVAVALLGVQLVISSAASGQWAAMLPKVVGIVYGILVFFVIVRIVRTERLIAVGIGVYIAGGAGLAVIGVMGMFLSGEAHFRRLLELLIGRIPQKNWGFEGAEAGLNPNAVAGVLLLFVPLCMALFVNMIRERKAMPGAGLAFIPLLGLLTAFFLLVLFISQTIASWLALAGGLWLVISSKNIQIFGIIFIVLFSGLVLIVLPESDAEAAAERKRPYWIEKIKHRHLQWSVGITAVREKPLTGVGVNMLRREPGLGYKKAHAHNHMLHTAAEMGIPGLIAYLAILGGAWAMCRSVWLRPMPGWMRASARGLAGGQAAHVLFGLGDSIPLGAKPGIVFWISLGLIAALYHKAVYPAMNREHPE
ncbi:MAG: O-antigen ligase family protein [Acidobacteriota bacterium]|nr:O-antigen ligase family protein [Acidobacteriota bacterium]